MAELSPRRRSDWVTPDGTWVDEVGDEEVQDGYRKPGGFPSPKAVPPRVMTVVPYEEPSSRERRAARWRVARGSRG